MIQSPPVLTNNQVKAVLDFSAVKKSVNAMFGLYIKVGGKQYTIGTDTFIDVVDKFAICSPIEIAKSFIAAINFDPDYRGIRYEASHVGTANVEATAYISGATIVLVSRSGAGFTVDASGFPDVTTPVVAVEAQPDSFGQFSVGAAVTALPSNDCKSFDIENLSEEDETVFVKCLKDNTIYKLLSFTGNNFPGPPSQYTLTASAEGVPVQLKYYFR